MLRKDGWVEVIVRGIVDGITEGAGEICLFCKVR